jgi:titin
VTKPRVLEELRDVNLVEGGRAVFECKILGSPLSIQWFKGDMEIKNQFRYKMSHDDNTGVTRLVINTVLEDDNGVYTCRASNTLGEVTTSAKLVPAQGKYFDTIHKERLLIRFVIS